MKLGQLIRIRGYSKGEDQIHVIVSGPLGGRVRACYVGSERFFIAKTWATDFVIVELDETDQRVKHARAMLKRHALKRADGWIVVPVGRYGAVLHETIGHEALL